MKNEYLSNTNLRSDFFLVEPNLITTINSIQRKTNRTNSQNTS